MEELGILHKVVVVLTPDETLPARWADFCDAVADRGWLGQLRDLDLDRALFVAPRADGEELLVLEGLARDATHYLESIPYLVGARPVPAAGRDAALFGARLTQRQSRAVVAALGSLFAVDLVALVLLVLGAALAREVRVGHIHVDWRVLRQFDGASDHW
jgi:hypothetical protein